MFDLFAKLQREQRRLKNDKYRFLFDLPPDNNLVCFDCESSSFDVKKADILSFRIVYSTPFRIR